MDSFIDNALQSLDEIRQDAVRVQQHATKYGYKIEEESTFKHLDREALEAEAVAQQRVEEHIRTRNKVFITYFAYNYVKSTRQCFCPHPPRWTGFSKLNAFFYFILSMET